MYLEIFLADFAVFHVFWEFRGISRKYLNFAGPQPREISEALLIESTGNSVSYDLALILMSCAAYIICVVVQLFILGLNFILLCLKSIIIHFHTPKQRNIKLKLRIKLNHNIWPVLYKYNLHNLFSLFFFVI